MLEEAERATQAIARSCARARLERPRGRMDSRSLHRRAAALRGEVRAWLAANVPGGITAQAVDDADSLARYRELRASAQARRARLALFARTRAVRRRRATWTTRSSSRKRRSPRPGAGRTTTGRAAALGDDLVWGTRTEHRSCRRSIAARRTWQLLTEPGAAPTSPASPRGIGTATIRDHRQKIFLGSDHGADRIGMIA